MSQTVYLQNPVGVAQSYEVEKGVKLSDGASGWVAFAADGGNISRKIGEGRITRAQNVSTAADAKASMEIAVVSVTIPAGATIVSTYAIGMLSGGWVQRGQTTPSYVYASAEPSNTSTSQVVNPDQTTTITANFKCYNVTANLVAEQIGVNSDVGTIGTQVYLEVVYR